MANKRNVVSQPRLRQRSLARTVTEVRQGGGAPAAKQRRGRLAISSFQTPGGRFSVSASSIAEWFVSRPIGPRRHSNRQSLLRPLAGLGQYALVPPLPGSCSVAHC